MPPRCRDAPRCGASAGGYRAGSRRVRWEQLTVVSVTKPASGTSAAVMRGSWLDRMVPNEVFSTLQALNRLVLVLNTLLSNAIVYSPAGDDLSITVVRVEQTDGPEAVLTVRDYGLGMPTAELPASSSAIAALASGRRCRPWSEVSAGAPPTARCLAPSRA
jgi:hypothetical protein